MDLEFSGDVLYWRGPAPWYFVAVPDDASVLLHAMSAEVSYGWGCIPVRIRLGNRVMLI